MVTVKIVIPTKGRAHSITSHLYVKDSIVCVGESEAAAYRDKVGNVQVVAHPDSIIGIALKRQWIYEKFGDVFMMDDDLKGIERLSAKQGERSGMDAVTAYEVIQYAANMAKLMGCYVFGFNNFVRPEHYHGHKPFALTGYINGCGLGMLAGAEHLKFNPAIKTNNDFYIAGLNAYYYRKCFIDKRFCMAQDSFGNNIGGCADVRTHSIERKDYDLLQHYFGGAVKLKTAGNTRAKHEYSKTLEIPF